MAVGPGVAVPVRGRGEPPGFVEAALPVLAAAVGGRLIARSVR